MSKRKMLHLAIDELECERLDALCFLAQTAFGQPSRHRAALIALRRGIEALVAQGGLPVSRSDLKNQEVLGVRVPRSELNKCK